MEPHGPSLPAVIQVLLELDGSGQWTAHSLELLSDARVVAGQLSGSVTAWVVTPPHVERMPVERLATGGCHRLRHVRNQRLAGWSSEAVAAALVEGNIGAGRLILLPGTPRGEEVAAILAELLETIWVPDAISVTASGVDLLEVRAVLANRQLSQGLTFADDTIAVVTVGPGVADIKPSSPVQVQVESLDVDLDSVPSLTSTGRTIPADPRTVDLRFAPRIIAVGRGAQGAVGVALATELAEILGASLGASRMAVDLGWVPPVRQVGQTGRTVRPDLYLACGISGASHHLVGMKGSKHIVSINSDPKAPIHEVAHLILPGDLHLIIPAVLKALRHRLQARALSP